MKKKFLMWSTLIVGSGDLDQPLRNATLTGVVKAEGDWDRADGPFDVACRVIRVGGDSITSVDKLFWALTKNLRARIYLGDGAFSERFNWQGMRMACSGYYDLQTDTITLTCFGSRPQNRRSLYMEFSGCRSKEKGLYLRTIKK